MERRDPHGRRSDIDDLVERAALLIPPEDFAAGLDESQSDALMALHTSIADRFGAKAASRAVAKLGGAAGLQQVLRSMHKAKLAGSRQARLMAELDTLLRDTSDLDRVRSGLPPPPETPSGGSAGS